MPVNLGPREFFNMIVEELLPIEVPSHGIPFDLNKSKIGIKFNVANERY